MSFKHSYISGFSRRIGEPVFALQFFSVVRFAAFFMVSVLLVKIPLDLEQIASYEYVLFLSSIVTGWWIHGFIQSFMADCGGVGGNNPNHSSITFRAYSRLLILQGGGILLLCALGIKLFSIWRFLTPLPQGFYLFLLFHFMLQAGVLLVYYFHQKKWTQYIYLFSGYFFITFIGSFLLLIQDKFSLADVYLCLVICSSPVLAAWIYYYFKTIPVKNINSTKRNRFPHLHILMLIQAIGFLSLWSDGFWVQYFYGTEKIFALFRYGGREFPLFVILTSTFATAMIPLAQDEAGLSRIRKGSIRFIRLFSPLVIGLLISSQWLFGWVYSKEFVPASIIFDAYLLLTFVRVLFPRPLLIAGGKFRNLLLVSVGELLINVILSLIFYQFWGITGLILATLVAHFFELIASLYLVRQKLNMQINQFVPVKLYMLFLVTIAFTIVVKYVLFVSSWKEMLL